MRGKYGLWAVLIALAMGGLLACSHASALERGLKVVEITGQQGSSFLYERSHALVIGVSDYTSGWPKLPGVAQDVALVRKALEAQGFSVEVVLNPSRAKLYSAYLNFILNNGQDENNRLLFYFAGHGYTEKLVYGGEMGYIVPVDAPNPSMDPTGFRGKAMDMEQIEVFAKRIQSKHAMFIFDSCFSGSIFSLSREIPASISYKTARPVRQFITSGSAEEQVPDKSIFRGQFISALQGEADGNNDGYVTGTELGEFLQDRVVNYSNASQHPQYGKIRNPHLDKGDFVFALPARTDAPTPAPVTALTAVEQAPAVSREAAELSFWDTIKGSTNAEDFQAYLDEYPQGRFTTLAKIRVRRLTQTPTEPAAPRQQESDQINEWLRTADRHLAALRLTTPEGDSALFYYRKVLAEDSSNAAAREGLNRIAGSYLDLAERALNRGQRSKARTYVGRGLEVVGDHSALLEMKAELDAPRTASVPGAPSSSGVLQDFFDSMFPSNPSAPVAGGGATYRNLTGRWSSADGELIVIQGNSYASSEDGVVIDSGSYTISGKYLVVDSIMGFDRSLEYSLRGDTLTIVDTWTGFPQTYVYQRVR